MGKSFKKRIYNPSLELPRIMVPRIFKVTEHLLVISKVEVKFVLQISTPSANGASLGRFFVFKILCVKLPGSKVSIVAICQAAHGPCR